jgi:phenylacetate-CoA ligase
MTSLSSHIYAAAPTFARNWMASAHGYLAQRRRYGEDTEQLVQAALQRESWDADQWNRWRNERLEQVLTAAVKFSPHYRDQWADRGAAERTTWRDLSAWPVLEKESLRSAPETFLVETESRRHYSVVQTSGTTGTPLTVWHSRQTQREWYALFEARSRRWYGVTGDDAWAILGGKLVKPVGETAPPYWVWNRPMRQLYMSTYHLTPERVPHYLQALAEYRVRYLYGYTSALYELALATLESGREVVCPKVIITNAEPVFPYQRAAIEAAFQCPLRESYGLSEYCIGASECEAGSLHVWSDAGVMEIMDDSGTLRSDGAGEFVVTSLLKREMPLVRYRIGDRGELDANAQRCHCGRTLPILKSIDGRVDDVLITPRGERVGRLDPVFKANLPIREAQVVQEAIDRLLVRYVPCDGFMPAHEKQMAQALRARMGEIQVHFEAVSQIPRTRNGKFRAVVNLLTKTV